jgi:ADP-dependent NAD(P)H-hydrate dehydratase / NAD(P)H-hydrate epimerase
MTGLKGLYSVASVRSIEAEWLSRSAPGALMARAAAAVADQATRMLRRMPPATIVLLLVGPGNNGGDALQAGRLLNRRGFAVRACGVASIMATPPTAPDAAAAWSDWHDDGLTLQPLEDEATWRSLHRPLVIDGLFGIGLSRALPASITPLLDWIGRTGAPVLAIDIPSGIDAGTGGTVGGGLAVAATLTVTMIADKPGLHTGAGLEAAGRTVVAPLTDATEEVGARQPVDSELGVRGVPADAVLLDAAAAARLLPRRGVNAHKGTSGDVLVIGGRLGMTGAARLAARGALGAGAGKVWIAGDPRRDDAADPQRPEIMRHPLRPRGPLPSRLGVIVIGCGLGQDRQASQYLESAIASPALLVCDADALNLVATSPRLVGLVRGRAAGTVLTPHPLEAARLLSWPTARVQADRIAAARELARRFQAVAVLKGAGTVVAAGSGHYAINASGNPVLAAGGTGDVLAGIVGGLAAGLLAGADASSAAASAACCGVWLHGAAADLAARQSGPAGVPAGAIADLLPEVLRLELQGARDDRRADVPSAPGYRPC